MAETTPAVGVCTLCGCAGDSFRRARKTRLPQQGWSVHALNYARIEPHRVTAQVEDPKGLLKREWQTIGKESESMGTDQRIPFCTRSNVRAYDE
jgi:hypothetical protein